MLALGHKRAVALFTDLFIVAIGTILMVAFFGI